MTRPSADQIAFSALLLLGGLLFFRLTLPLGRMAQMVPIRVLVPTIALLVLQLVLDGRARRNTPSPDHKMPESHGLVPDGHRSEGPSDRRLNTSSASGNTVREYQIIFLLGFLPALIYLIGFVFSAALFIWFYYRVYFKKKFLVSASLSLCAALFLYVVMILLLGMDMGAGLIWRVAGSAI
ncbi:MAG: hypothetical protein JJV98_01100 [Desulfosarcina sp.]|nr:hypothetical protein [Desulfobacterales bacterium]